MKYISSAQAAKAWGVSEELVRRYCRSGRIQKAILEDGAWLIPDSAPKPTRRIKQEEQLPVLLQQLRKQFESGRNKGLYDYLQVNMAYSNCRMASNRLTRNQVEVLYKSDKIYTLNERIKTNDVIEVRNQFNCMDYILAEAMTPITQTMILKLHFLCLSDCCRHRRKPVVYDDKQTHYRTKPADAKYGKTSAPRSIASSLETLFQKYESRSDVSFRDVLELHVRFEQIRPFDDCNGRIGRLLMLKECLRHGITPFIIDDKKRAKYLAGMQRWDKEKGILMDVCMEAQIRFEKQIALQEIRTD